jgi:hypothetical protein
MEAPLCGAFQVSLFNILSQFSGLFDDEMETIAMQFRDAVMGRIRGRLMPALD